MSSFDLSVLHLRCLGIILIILRHQCSVKVYWLLDSGAYSTCTHIFIRWARQWMWPRSKSSWLEDGSLCTVMNNEFGQSIISNCSFLLPPRSRVLHIQSSFGISLLVASWCHLRCPIFLYHHDHHQGLTYLGLVSWVYYSTQPYLKSGSP